MLRKLLSSLRRFGEGAAAFVLAAALWPAWGGRLLRWPGDVAVRRDFGRARARWGRCLRRGLSDWREAWWPLYEVDGQRTLLRRWLALEWGALRSARPAAATAPGIVVYTPGHIGDLLHVVPMLDALLRRQPGVPVTWVVGPWVQGLARAVAPGARVLAFAPPLPQFQRGRARGLSPRGLREQLPGSVSILLSTSATDPVTAWLAACCRPRVWVGMAPEPAGMVFAEQQTFQPYERDRYEAEAVMALLAPAGLAPEPVRLRMPVAPGDQASARALRESLGLPPSDRYVTMAPGSGWPGKNWPADRFGAVAAALQAARGVRTLVLGGPDEVALGDAVAGAGAGAAINLAGRTSLGQSAALVAESALYIGNDSGLLHVAAACGVSTVGLFGPTRPGRWAPRGPRHVALRAVESCDGCLPWHPRARCRHEGACMKKIAAAEVTAAAERLLAS
jgi:ADP-heptose:LPS heptosyltransferase